MRVTVEISLYPLEDRYIDRIEAMIVDLRRQSALDISVNQMSTQLNGELDEVMAALGRAIEASFGNGRPQALVAKFVNADLSIHEAPPV